MLKEKKKPPQQEFFLHRLPSIQSCSYHLSNAHLLNIVSANLEITYPRSKEKAKNQRLKNIIFRKLQMITIKL